MAFDKTFPVPTTKIRDLSTGIPNNWDAIEGADATFKPEGLNLNNRTPLVSPNDPIAISDAIVTYCKDDSNGNPQMYAIDPSNVISQLTPMINSFTDQGGDRGNGTITIGQLIIAFGQTTGTTGAKIFETGYSFPTAALCLIVSTNADGATYGSFKNLKKTGFDWTANGTIAALKYIAIGY